MSTTDPRRPAEVSAEFRGQLARVLEPRGFVSRARGARFVRRAGGATHEVALSSSHYNAPGSVAGWVALRYDARDVTALEPSWYAGGGLHLEPFGGQPTRNLASPSEASQLLDEIVAALTFFDLLDEPERLLGEACRRYVPGLLDPRNVAPYLRARVGAAAVTRYARAFLDGRPELWASFVGHAGERALTQGSVLPDEGTQLAVMLASHGDGAVFDAPSGTVRSLDAAAGNLRSHFGLRLRAWGEPEAAARLRTVDDARVHALPTGAAPNDVEPIRRALGELLGDDRPPRRSAPDPLLFQYRARHPPFQPEADARRG